MNGRMRNGGHEKSTRCRNPTKFKPGRYRMSDRMRPVPLSELIIRSMAEYRAKGSFYDIPQEHFYRPKIDVSVDIFGQKVGNPAGPAAGPHTQLAQNILCAFLTGARYFELKTVQKLDKLEIEKPCIDARDEGYNVEWSTEFTLEQAFDEYLKGWFLLHVYRVLVCGSVSTPVLFNMSVGYDLAGIQTERMNLFVDKLIHAREDPLFARYREEIRRLFSDESLLGGTGFAGCGTKVREVIDTISDEICRSVTLSTMHGCPPDEIEGICRYMLLEKGLDTLVKLNPTLLGFERVRGTLDELGFGYVKLEPSGFDRDLQLADGISMIKRLWDLGQSHNKVFGVKLSNTLATVNDGSTLPGEEMYLSGRALYPLTIGLAATLAAALGEGLPISFSGGVSAWNFQEILDVGIRPVTLATDLLKPGGYSRLKELAEIAESYANSGKKERLDVPGLQNVAERAFQNPLWKKRFRGGERVSVQGRLPLFDCFVAPCIETCPISQDIPEYIHLAGNGEYAQAFSVIYSKNPLPFITGYLCDHQCTGNCTRLDWEGAVDIREIKRIVAERGYEEFRRVGNLMPSQKLDIKVAVIGGGPAGMASAAFLARRGFSVHLFERRDTLGGVVGHVIPGFRIPEYIVRRDESLLRDAGAEIHLSSESPGTVDELKALGYRYVLIGIGAEVDKPAPVDGALGALEFLRDYREHPKKISLGAHVAVIGAGDTAMDAARAAVRCGGVEKVLIVYRRSRAQMPATDEEYEAAIQDGVEFEFLRSPVGWESENGDTRMLRCSVMELGKPDRSGRARPVQTNKLETYRADTVISAIGQDIQADALRSMIPAQAAEDDPFVMLVGDAATGAATIVKAIESARDAADEISRREGIPVTEPLQTDIEKRTPLRERRDRIRPKSSEGHDEDEKRLIEADRCLGCRELCLKCVEVCPNRANTPIRIPGTAKDVWQIIHLDAFCNECGNCTTFCPWDGEPYRDKFTVFSLRQDFLGSSNPGFWVDGEMVSVRFDEKVTTFPWDAEGSKTTEPYLEEVVPAIESIMREYSYLLGSVDT